MGRMRGFHGGERGQCQVPRGFSIGLWAGGGCRPLHGNLPVPPSRSHSAAVCIASSATSRSPVANRPRPAPTRSQAVPETLNLGRLAVDEARQARSRGKADDPEHPQQVQAICRREGRHAMVLSRGANAVIAFWIENARMLELMTPDVTRANGTVIRGMKLSNRSNPIVTGRRLGAGALPPSSVSALE